MASKGQRQETPHLPNNISSTDGKEYITYLFHASSLLHGQLHDVAERFCREVTIGTQGRAYLALTDYKAFNAPPVPSIVFLSLPVQFRDIHYGALHILPDCTQPIVPAIPLETSVVLANMCALLLHSFEMTALFQMQSLHLEYQVHRNLTKREQEILALMFRRHTVQEIADKLDIAEVTVCKHKQHIYECLGVHSEYDALLVAYQTGKFSILKEISSPASE